MREDIYNYAGITDSDKRVVKEVCRLCEEQGYHDFSNHLKGVFQLEKRERYNPETNKFFKKCKEKNVHLNYQGYMVEDNVEYPLFAFSGDLRQLEKLLD